MSEIYERFSVPFPYDQDTQDEPDRKMVFSIGEDGVVEITAVDDSGGFLVAVVEDVEAASALFWMASHAHGWNE